MELLRVDTKRAYDRIRDRITTLDLAPGSPINPQQLALDLGLALIAVQEALKLLAHENLVVITPRHGLYVSDVNAPDLQQLSETRLALEALSARFAAERATEDDLVVLEALRQEQAATPPGDTRRLLEVDHRFHQAIAKAARNKYLTEALEHLFGLSQRLWFMALQPHPAAISQAKQRSAIPPAAPQGGTETGFLSTAVEKHLDLVEAIRAGDAGRAEQIMRSHVQGFYDQVVGALQAADSDHKKAERPVP